MVIGYDATRVCYAQCGTKLRYAAMRSAVLSWVMLLPGESRARSNGTHVAPPYGPTRALRGVWY
eukprot:3446162-Rhodomonas_salina.2